MSWFTKEFWALKEAHLSLRKAMHMEMGASAHRKKADESWLTERTTHVHEAATLESRARRLRGRHMFYLIGKLFSRD